MREPRPVIRAEVTEKNKTLRNTLKDDASKENLKNALKALLSELEDAE